MKIRIGFVSNSSSSSFIIKKWYISAYQADKIRNHSLSGLEYADTDAWSINEDEETISGRTFMDSFDMHNFLESIGINMDNVKWSEW